MPLIRFMYFGTDFRSPAYFSAYLTINHADSFRYGYLNFQVLLQIFRDLDPLTLGISPIFTIQRPHITYPKGRVSCSADTFVQAESSVLRMKFSGKNTALRVAAKRCVRFL